MKNRNILFICGCIIICSACQRNSTTANTITFNGYVNAGHTDTTTNVLVIDARLANAVVTCDGFPGSATTASDGSYSLNVQSVRLFQGQNADTFTLHANSSGRDEKITASGKPGDTIKVRDFVLYKHTEE